MCVFSVTELGGNNQQNFFDRACRNKEVDAVKRVGWEERTNRARGLYTYSALALAAIINLETAPTTEGTR